MLTLQKFLNYVFVIFALIYLVAYTFGPFPGAEMIKTVPCLILAVIALIRVEGWQGKLLAVALVFSAAGDYLLGIQREGEQPYFVFGLGAFLMAHIAYTVIFSQNLKKQKTRYPVLIAVLLFGGILAWMMFPKLGELKVPVMVYLTVIMAMGVTATLREMKTPLLMLGALFFIISDSVIAVNKFLQEVPYAFYLIMITYYLAQYMIVRAFVLEGSLKSK